MLHNLAYLHVKIIWRIEIRVKEYSSENDFTFYMKKIKSYYDPKIVKSIFKKSLYSDSKSN